MKRVVRDDIWKRLRVNETEKKPESVNWIQNKVKATTVTEQKNFLPKYILMKIFLKK